MRREKKLLESQAARKDEQIARLTSKVEDYTMTIKEKNAAIVDMRENHHLFESKTLAGHLALVEHAARLLAQGVAKSARDCTTYANAFNLSSLHQFEVESWIESACKNGSIAFSSISTDGSSAIDSIYDVSIDHQTNLDSFANSASSFVFFTLTVY